MSYELEKCLYKNVRNINWNYKSRLSKFFLKKSLTFTDFFQNNNNK